MGQEYLKNSVVEVEISVAQEILQKTVKKFRLCLEILFTNVDLQIISSLK